MDMGKIPDDPGYSEDNFRSALAAALDIFDFLPPWPGGTVLRRETVVEDLTKVFQRTKGSGEPIWGRFMPAAQRVKRVQEKIAERFPDAKKLAYHRAGVDQEAWGVGLGAAQERLGILGR